MNAKSQDLAARADRQARLNNAVSTAILAIAEGLGVSPVSATIGTMNVIAAMLDELDQVAARKFLAALKARLSAVDGSKVAARADRAMFDAGTRIYDAYDARCAQAGGRIQ